MNFRQLDLNLLRALDVMMDERHVTRAAERLALSQPALSATLNRLRSALGDPLFVRGPRGMVPTERALVLGPQVKRLLHDLEVALQAPAFDPAVSDFTLTVSATDYALHAVVLPFITALRPLAPRARIAVLPGHADDVRERLERGDLDMALMTPDTSPADLHCRRLFDERYVCVLREGHPATLRPWDLDAFCALDHGIVSLEGGGFRGPTDQALAALGRERRVTVSVPGFGMLLDVVRCSDIVALLPSRLLSSAPDLVHREPPLAVPGFSKWLVWHARTHAAPRQRWVREQLFHHCGGQA